MCQTEIMRKATILLICAAAWAQSPPATDPPKREDVLIQTNVNVVVAPTTVRDKNGDFIDGLQLQDFELYDNNKLQKISADVRDEPLSLVIAVQKSSNL